MTVTVVGLGCGAKELLTGEARNALALADMVFVTKGYRHLACAHPNVFVMENIREAVDVIREETKNCSNIAVGVSGDPGIFSMLSMLKAALSGIPGVKIDVIPGVSSLSYFFAKLGMPWNDAKIISGHGRGLDSRRLMRTVLENAKTAVFCDDTRNPEWVCSVLEELQRDFAEEGTLPLEVAVGASLSLPGETIIEGEIPGVVPKMRGLGGHALVAVFAGGAKNAPLSRPGDDDFIRTSVPMTRREVRSAILDELALRRDSVVWDIGAGTGSVAIACSALCPDGSVHAVERAPEAASLIRLNRKRFRAVNLDVYEGSAPDILPELPKPTHVFVGGSGGNLGGILEHVPKLGAGIRTCIASVTLETASEASRIMAGGGAFRGLSVLNIAVTRSRPLGGSSLMAAQNPVTLWTAVTS